MENEQEVKHEVELLTRELFNSLELHEAQSRWHDAVQNCIAKQKCSADDEALVQCEGTAVKQSVNLSLDRDASARELLAELFAAVELSERGAARGFALLLHSCADIAVDVPDAPAQLALFLARAVVDRVILSTASVQHELALLPSDSSRYAVAIRSSTTSDPESEAEPQKVLQTSQQILKHARGTERVQLAWGGRHFMRTATAKQRFEHALAEFRYSSDVKEVARIVRDANIPHFAHEIVRQAVILAMTHFECQDAVIRLLEHLATSNTISHSQLDKGLQIVATQLCDLSMDIPDAKSRYEFVVSQLSHVIPTSWSTFRQVSTGLGRLSSTPDFSSSLSNMALNRKGLHTHQPMEGYNDELPTSQSRRRIQLLHDKELVNLGSFGNVGARGHTLETLQNESTAKLGRGLIMPAFRHNDRRLQVTPQHGKSYASKSSSSTAGIHKSMSTPSTLQLAGDANLVKPEARARNYSPFEVNYKLSEDVLGQGGFAVVRRAIHRNTKEEYAAKIIRLSEDGDDSDINNVPGPSSMDWEEISNELALLVKLGKHPGITSIHEYFILDHACVIIMDILRGKDLVTELCLKQGGYSERDVAISMSQVFSAVGYMHSLNIAHRDLKVENLHLRLPQQLESTTVVDMGLAKAIQSSQKMTDVCGTPEYAAPELILEKPYTVSVDSWSLGICL